MILKTIMMMKRFNIETPNQVDGSKVRLHLILQLPYQAKSLVDQLPWHLMTWGFLQLLFPGIVQLPTEPRNMLSSQCQVNPKPMTSK